MTTTQTDAAVAPTLDAYLGNVVRCVEQGDYDTAVAEMRAATEHYKRDRENLTRTMDDTIAHLSSKDGQYNAPVPQALALIRLKNSLMAKNR